jgi:hypothetical protein
MHELGKGALARKLVERLGEFEVVVLSHADENHFVLTDKRLEPVVSAAFHLLFTEPSTHPDQVAHWMRATKIRAEDRIHVISGTGRQSARSARRQGSFSRRSKGSPSGSSDALSKVSAGPRPRRSTHWRRHAASMRTLISKG